jgi:hypothetical protein
MRNTARVVLALALASLAVVPAARAGDATLARFKWSVAGSMQHNWTLASSEPCGVYGNGVVKLTFKGTGKGALKVTRNAYGVFYDYDPQVTLRGSITMVDNTTQNPDERGEPCRPTDKSGCGTRSLKNAFGYLQTPAVARERRLEFFGGGLGDAFSVGDCEKGEFQDFGRVNSRYLPTLFPGVPLPAALARRRGTFTVSKTRTDKGQGTPDRQMRSVTVKFTRLR